MLLLDKKYTMQNNIPKHIGIIIDGNRRWAKSRGLAGWQGHEHGYQNLKKIAQHAFGKGVSILTVFAFSTENWKRKKTEVNFLFKLIRRLVAEEVEELHQQGVKFDVLGDISKFDKNLQQAIVRAQKLTAYNKKGTLNVCLNYGGRQEIIQAIKNIVTAKVFVKNLTEKQVSDFLYTAGQPDPDLIIRTSGEQRLSNFLTWQSVYSELYFCPKYWPDFSTRDFDLALKNYTDRARRFGQ